MGRSAIIDSADRIRVARGTKTDFRGIFIGPGGLRACNFGTGGALNLEREQAMGGSTDPTIELFERAVAQHSRRLLAIARAIVGTRASPEDVVQQAVTNLFQHRMRYDWREPGGLLKRAVVNESLRLLRHPRMAMVGDEQPDRTQTPISEMIENETVRQVRSAIAKLPDHFRAALVLCEYENLSYADIAASLDASVPQVKTWIFRARRQIEKMLRDYVENNKQGAPRAG